MYYALFLLIVRPLHNGREVATIVMCNYVWIVYILQLVC